MSNQNIDKNIHRVRYNNEQYDSSSWKISNDNTNEGEEESIFPKNILKRYIISGENGLTENTEPDEEIYDYEKFKKEYEEQIVEDINNKNNTFNDTKEKIDELAEETLKNLFNFTNCTETSKKLGIKAIDCFIHNYELEKDKPIVKKTVSKIWLIIKVWLLIYICLAIPCWCHKGWCCCCFRCGVCFPRKRIHFAKEYYALNSPGTLNKEEEKQFITYEPTEFEEDAYNTFEAAIRNI
ncbi:uncharacterized protein LOC114880574 isoform X1 [Osmia bicornis bicornis]|uniref:uncharacterized protein LOC114880574 isoform X1 n=1 Tax=Osmia bicornis bicornis TaxID=1437191 RepID=UPI0010F5C4E6|nr:uncharacterized protein LOC114880574 isoform X1 [Osmia bicornis bicornis]XP_029052550.1 uncharacterized protein LOC114880574 isoform X1 [Osmia bicornis bicornis]